MVRKLQEYFFYFLLYSVIGWLYEVFLEVVVYQWGFSNRGALFGPYCIIYGVGALILIFSLSGLQKKRIYVGKILITPVVVFIGIIIITTVVELAGSYIMEIITGNWMWDYRSYGVFVCAAAFFCKAQQEDSAKNLYGDDNNFSGFIFA